LTVEGSTVRMTRKIIHQPVINTVWNIETYQLLKKSNVADRIKRSTEIKCNDNNVWLIIEKLGYSVEKLNKGQRIKNNNTSNYCLE